MPEIWLNYGATDVVFDVQAENYNQSIRSTGSPLDGKAVAEKLGALDLKKPFELVILDSSNAVRGIVEAIFSLCGQKSLPTPKILADRRTVNVVKASLPEGGIVSEFGDEMPDSRLVFIAETELDGLFGYETVATRLLRRFGQEHMLSAYAKRAGNSPAPGQITQSAGEARAFADKFEIQAIDIVASSEGIVDFEVGHPSKSDPSKSFEAMAVKDAGVHKSVIISTGKHSSNGTLGKALNSLWSCSPAVGRDGLAVLLAESKFGVGSDAVQQFIEGRMTPERLKNPSKYVGGMEDLLFLTEVQKTLQIGLVSILPEFYVKKLGMISLNGAKLVMDYILKTQGARQKITLVEDGSRVLLR